MYKSSISLSRTVQVQPSPGSEQGFSHVLTSISWSGLLCSYEMNENDCVVWDSV